MKLIDRLKQKVYAYVDYRSNEMLYRNLYYSVSPWMTHYALHSNDMGVSSEQIVDGRQVIVSLTTYDKRLYEVYLTIESIMQQTLKPNKIILWLADELAEVNLPITLQRQQQRGLEVRYCKDIRSYKKLIPTLKQYPKDIIITVDDDVIYNIDLIENLVNAYKKNPNCIWCGLSHRITLDSANNVLPYKLWNNDDSMLTSKSLLNMPVGCGGVLYPPCSLHDEVFNEEVFLDSCKYGDDIWFKAMSLKKEMQCCQLRSDIHSHWYIDNPTWQNKGLTRINCDEDLNNQQLDAVFVKYDLFNIIK